jgi:ankyrin repeat protein
LSEISEETAKNEAEFFAAVERDDIDLVKSKLNDTNNIEISKDSYITPIILAAQLGHYEIVNFLIQNNYVIEEPHDCKLNCSEECKKKSDMFRSQIAINRFRGLSNPVYMCLR